MLDFFRNINNRLKSRRLAEKKDIDNYSDIDEIKESSTNMQLTDNNINQLFMVETAPRDMDQLIRGSKRRYHEDIDYNLSLTWKRMPDENLVFEKIELGKRGKKKVVIAYLKDVANPDLVEEVKKRIRAIKAEAITDLSYLERNIENSNTSPFPQVELCARPDVTETALLQGRIAIFLDESPEVLLAPTTFFDMLDTPEDSFTRWYVAASFFRIARYIMFILAATLPAFYIALTSFNPEFLPTSLVFLIAASAEGTPFPVYFEAFVMMGVVEAVRLVLIRMPSAFGSAIAIFSGIVLVGAGLSANIFGVPIVIIVTLTIITSFGVPNFDLRSSLRMIQFFTMIMATLFGVFGFAIAFFYIAIHLATLKSFGIPYMAPLAPVEGSGFSHAILRSRTEQMPQDETYKPQKLSSDNKKGEKGNEK